MKAKKFIKEYWAVALFYVLIVVGIVMINDRFAELNEQQKTIDITANYINQ